MSIGETLVYGRLEEICPAKNTREMSEDELINDCNVAFQIIGYTPKNLEDSVRKVCNQDIPALHEFVFQVWLHDD